MSKPANGHSDPLLLPFLQAPSDEVADSVLSHLISVYAEPIVRHIVGYKFRVFFNDKTQSLNNDAEDVHSEAIVNLLGRLAQLRSNPQLGSIKDFRGYVAVTSYRACHEHLRRKYPRRFSLKNKLRYFLRHQKDFALWQVDTGEWIAGFAWWPQTPPGESGRLNQLRDQFQEFESKTLPGGTAIGTSLNELLHSIFEWTGVTIELDELVGIVATAWRIRDLPTSEESGHKADDMPSPGPGRKVDDAVCQRELLVNLWTEIVKMSQRHCAALLLNFRDENGESALDLFLFTGVASFPQIAASIGETEESLAEVWNQLPLEDAKIAERLGLIRQQVINLRKTARVRLAKYMDLLGT